MHRLKNVVQIYICTDPAQKTRLLFLPEKTTGNRFLLPLDVEYTALAEKL
jgi:hypothetical protein